MLALVLLRPSKRPAPSSVPAPQLASTVSAALCSGGEAGQGAGGLAVRMPDEGASHCIPLRNAIRTHARRRFDPQTAGTNHIVAGLAEPKAAEQRCSTEPKFRTRVYQSLFGWIGPEFLF